MTKPRKPLETIVTSIPIDQIVPNPWNRKQFDPKGLKGLAASIRAEGIREPLIVRLLSGGGREGRTTRESVSGSPIRDTSPRGSRRPPLTSTDSPPFYEIASGNRRWLAAKMIGLKTVPCLVENLSDEQVAEDNITMNIQREDIPPLELARMVQDYMTRFDKTQAEAARQFGKSRGWASQLLGFLKMPPEARKVFNALNISWRTLLLIRSLPLDLTIKLAQEAKDVPLSARGLEKRCRQLLFGSKSKGRFEKEEPLEDPLKKVWPPLEAKAELAPDVNWLVQYGLHKYEKGPAAASSKMNRGWFFFVSLPIAAADNQAALATWFTQMGKALGGGKYEPQLPQALQQGQALDEAMIHAAGPMRLPKTPAEEKELQSIAKRGTPQDVYAWIYGKDSPYISIAPPLWNDLGTTPAAGLKDLLDTLRMFEKK